MLCSGTFYVLADFGVAAAVVKQPPPAAIETTQRAVVGDDEDEDEDEEELRADAFARQRREAGAVGGTQAFDSPELFEGQHRDGASDMWAFGVTIYVLYFGVVPFTVVRGLSSLRDAVMRGELTFPPPREGDDEEDYAAICTIIRALLIKPSSSRWTAHEAFKYVHRYLRNQDHTWVRSVPSSSLTVNEPHVIPPACVPVVPAQRGRVRHSAAAVMPFARRRIVEAQRHTGAQYSQDDASDVDARTQDILSM